MATEKPDKINLALGIIAAAIHLSSYFVYSRQMFLGASHPNAATWGIWLVTSTMNCVFYFQISRDKSKIILPTVSTLATFVTFGYALAGGKFSGFSDYDIIAFIIGLAAAGVWWRFRNAGYASLIIQASIIASIVPTCISVWKNPGTESAWPWFVWSSAYVFLVVNIVRRHKSWLDFVYPINCLVLHAAVGLLALR